MHAMDEIYCRVELLRDSTTVTGELDELPRELRRILTLLPLPLRRRRTCLWNNGRSRLEIRMATKTQAIIS
jgi:hypothetical protein